MQPADFGSTMEVVSRFGQTVGCGQVGLNSDAEHLPRIGIQSRRNIYSRNRPVVYSLRRCVDQGNYLGWMSGNFTGKTGAEEGVNKTDNRTFPMLSENGFCDVLNIKSLERRR